MPAATAEYELFARHMLYTVLMIASRHEPFNLYYSSTMHALVERVFLQALRVMELEGSVPGEKEWVVECFALVFLEHAEQHVQIEKEEVLHYLQFGGSHSPSDEGKELLKSVTSRIRGESADIPTSSRCGCFYHVATTRKGGQTLRSLVTVAEEEKVDGDAESVKLAFSAMMKGVDAMHFFDMEREEAIERITKLDKDKLVLLLLMLQYAAASESVIWEGILDLVTFNARNTRGTVNPDIQMRIAYMLRTTTVNDNKWEKVNEVLSFYSCKL